MSGKLWKWKLRENYFESRKVLRLKIVQIKKVKVAKCVEKSQPSPITRSSESEDNLSPIIRNNSKMPPAASPPVLSSWAPILFPPWNPGLLPAAFYPAALRSLPTWVTPSIIYLNNLGRQRQKLLTNHFQMFSFQNRNISEVVGNSWEIPSLFWRWLT